MVMEKYMIMAVPVAAVFLSVSEATDCRPGNAQVR